MSTIRLERKGDLVSYVFLTAKFAGVSNTFTAGTNSDIKKVELLIGGQVIDSQTDNFITKVADPYLVSSLTKAAASPTDFYPLHFWFCENYQSALPLVSLQYHDVEIRIIWNKPQVGFTYECFADFIYLDTTERKQLAQGSQDILIYQVQESTGMSGRVHDIQFNHPIKFLAASEKICDDETLLRFQINGTDVGESKLYTPHFNLVPQYFHCQYITSSTKEAFLYPFCLDTNKLQPTGTLNFSRLDSARLMIDSSNKTFADGDTQILYGVNYNILRIQNGMGGLLYAN